MRLTVEYIELYLHRFANTIKPAFIFFILFQDIKFLFWYCLRLH